MNKTGELSGEASVKVMTKWLLYAFAYSSYRCVSEECNNYTFCSEDLHVVSQLYTCVIHTYIWYIRSRVQTPMKLLITYLYLLITVHASTVVCAYMHGRSEWYDSLVANALQTVPCLTCMHRHLLFLECMRHATTLLGSLVHKLASRRTSTGERPDLLWRLNIN